MPTRMRRLRSKASARALICESRLSVDDLVLPIFVKEGIDLPEPVESMPGVFRWPLAMAATEAESLYKLGIRAVALFPCPSPTVKDEQGSEALSAGNLAHRAIRELKRGAPDLLVITDVALDPYTSHGHDGILTDDGRDVDNDRTVSVLAKMAVAQAEAGADWVAPSDMMDGRVRAIRMALDEAGYNEVAILAYSAKYASAYYGPFRDAVGSQQAAGNAYLDKSTYQLSPSNPRESVRDALLDEREGADLLMVKPAGPYLDILASLRRETRLPLAAYQVSGEYAQIHAAAEKGWLDLERTRDESLLAIKRAGADIILTYFAKELAAAARA